MFLAVAATIRASPPAVATTVPAFGSARKFSAAAATTKATLRLSSAAATVKSSVRKFAALATPRLPAATTTTALRLSSAAATATPTTFRLSSAAATMKGPIRFAAPLRNTHTAALPEALEARIKQLEADLDNKILLLRAELHKGSVEACEKVEKGVFEAYRKLEKAHLELYNSYLLGHSIHGERITTLSELILAESRRSFKWATESSAKSAKVMNLAGKTYLKVISMVAGTAGTTGFVTARMEARSKKIAEEDAMNNITARIDNAINGLGPTIERAVEIALAKQALEKKAVGSGEGGGPTSS